MPRLPAGLHRQSGAGRAGAFRLRRYTPTRQIHYQQEITSVLHAGGTGVFVPQSLLFQINSFAASTGPQGVGEKWQVDLVQVQAAGQYGQPPLVIQQQSAMAQAQTSSQPPPVIAQVWRQIGGVNIYLLGQSSNGGNDDIAISCPLLAAGERIAVLWYGPPSLSGTWFTLTGTRYTLATG